MMLLFIHNTKCLRIDKTFILETLKFLKCYKMPYVGILLEWAVTLQRDQMFIHRNVWAGTVYEWQELHPLVLKLSDHRKCVVMATATSGISVVRAIHP